MQIMGRRPDLRVVKTFMLQPTLHHIGDSPNGVKLTVRPDDSCARQYY